MKKLMYIFFALPILTGCKEKKSAGAMGGMPTPEISVTKPIIKNVTLTKDYPGYLTTEKTVQSPNQKIPDRKTKCVIKTHINIKQNVIFGAKLKPV